MNQKRSFTKPEWDRLFETPTDELTLALGAEQQRATLSMVSSHERLRRIAEEYLASKRQAICSSEKVQRAVLSSDPYLIASAVMDAVGAGGSATAAALVVRKGIELLCKEHWQQIPKLEAKDTKE